MTKTYSIEAWDLLTKTYRLVQSDNQRGFREHGLTASQFDILVFLGSKGPSSQNTLTRNLLVTKGNISSVLRGLEKRGFVSRKTPKKDRRLNIVSLTDSGRKMYTEAAVKNERKLVFSLSSITTKEKKDLIRTLKKVCVGMEKENR